MAQRTTDESNMEKTHELEMEKVRVECEIERLATLISLAQEDVNSEVENMTEYTRDLENNKKIITEMKKKIQELQANREALELDLQNKKQILAENQEQVERNRGQYAFFVELGEILRNRKAHLESADKEIRTNFESMKSFDELVDHLKQQIRIFEPETSPTTAISSSEKLRENKSINSVLEKRNEIDQLNDELDNLTGLTNRISTLLDLKRIETNRNENLENYKKNLTEEITRYSTGKEEILKQIAAPKKIAEENEKFIRDSEPILKNYQEKSMENEETLNKFDDILRNLRMTVDVRKQQLSELELEMEMLKFRLSSREQDEAEKLEAEQKALQNGNLRQELKDAEKKLKDAESELKKQEQLQQDYQQALIKAKKTLENDRSKFSLYVQSLIEAKEKVEKLHNKEREAEKNYLEAESKYHDGSEKLNRSGSTTASHSPEFENICRLREKRDRDYQTAKQKSVHAEGNFLFHENVEFEKQVDRINELKFQLDTQNDAVKESLENVKEAREVYNELQFQSQIDRATNENERLEIEIIRIEIEIIKAARKTLQERIDQIQRDIQTTSTAIDDFEKKRVELTEISKKQNEKKDELELEIQNRRIDIDSYNRQWRTSELDIKEFERKIEQANKIIPMVQQTLTAVETEFEKFEKIRREKMERIHVLETEINASGLSMIVTADQSEEKLSQIRLFKIKPIEYELLKLELEHYQTKQSRKTQDFNKAVIILRRIDEMIRQTDEELNRIPIDIDVDMNDLEVENARRLDDHELLANQIEVIDDNIELFNEQSDRAAEECVGLLKQIQDSWANQRKYLEEIYNHRIEKVANEIKLKHLDEQIDDICKVQKH